MSPSSNLLPYCQHHPQRNEEKKYIFGSFFRLFFTSRPGAAQQRVEESYRHIRRRNGVRSKWITAAASTNFAVYLSNSWSVPIHMMHGGWEGARKLMKLRVVFWCFLIPTYTDTCVYLLHMRVNT